MKIRAIRGTIRPTTRLLPDKTLAATVTHRKPRGQGAPDLLRGGQLGVNLTAVSKPRFGEVFPMAQIGDLFNADCRLLHPELREFAYRSMGARIGYGRFRNLIRRAGHRTAIDRKRLRVPARTLLLAMVVFGCKSAYPALCNPDDSRKLDNLWHQELDVLGKAQVCQTTFTQKREALKMCLDPSYGDQDHEKHQKACLDSQSLGQKVGVCSDQLRLLSSANAELWNSISQQCQAQVLEADPRTNRIAVGGTVSLRLRRSWQGGVLNYAMH